MAVVQANADPENYPEADSESSGLSAQSELRLLRRLCAHLLNSMRVHRPAGHVQQVCRSTIYMSVCPSLTRPEHSHYLTVSAMALTLSRMARCT